VTVTPTGRGSAFIEVQPRPADRVADANWFQVIAWQGAGDGDGGLVLADLRSDGNGTYVTSEPVPISGTWKTMIRLQRDQAVVSLPIYLPEDTDIPAAGVPAEPTFQRAFVPDKVILQRESVGGSPGLQSAAYALLAVIAMVWIGSLAWGIRRLERSQVSTGPAEVDHVSSATAT